MARLSLIVLAVVTVIFPLICVSDRKTRSAIADSLDQFPRNVLYHLRVRGTPAIRNENIADAWMQWGYHGGLYWTVGFWLAALILIYAARARSSRGNTRVLEQPAGGRHKCAMLLRQLSKSGLLLVLFMLVLYVLVSTVLLDQMQTEYDRQIARFADPNWMTKEIEAEIQKLALPPPGSVDNSTAP